MFASVRNEKVVVAPRSIGIGDEGDSWKDSVRSSATGPQGPCPKGLAVPATTSNDVLLGRKALLPTVKYEKVLDS
jgi:hypothetical protein